MYPIKKKIAFTIAPLSIAAVLFGATASGEVSHKGLKLDPEKIDVNRDQLIAPKEFAHFLTESASFIDAYRTEFDHCDSSRDGRITLTEAQQCGGSQKDFEQTDMNNDHRVDYAEFTQFFIMRIFSNLDQNNDQYLDTSELPHELSFS